MAGGQRQRVQTTRVVESWCRDCEVRRDHVLRTTWYPRRGADRLRPRFDPSTRYKLTCASCGRGRYVEDPAAVLGRPDPARPEPAQEERTGPDVDGAEVVEVAAGDDAPSRDDGHRPPR